MAAAAFDTRINKPHWLVGWPARAVEKRLRRLGFRVVAPSQRFYVAGTPGPLLDGEAERARRWGEKLASEFSVEEGNPTGLLTERANVIERDGAREPKETPCGSGTDAILRR